MSLESLGNIGEFIGGLAVIATLVYLALQIRQNTRAVRASALQAANDSAQRVLATVSQSPENAAVYHRGLLSSDELTPPQRMHFTTMLLGIFSASEAMYWNQRHGLLQDEIWDREVKVLRFYLQTPGGRAMWRISGALFSESFSQFVDAEVERLASSNMHAA